LIGYLVKKIFGTKNEREIKRLREIVNKINKLEPELDALSNKELIEENKRLKEKIRGNPHFSEAITQGEIIEELPLAFAIAREVAKRTLGLRPFDVQLIGALALHKGMIAEMKTGEGKTLVAAIAIYLNALTGKGVHLVTVNDYLAKRDATQMGSIYKFLGLSVGVINTNNASYLIQWADEEKFKKAVELDKRVWEKGFFGELLPPEKYDVEAKKDYFTVTVDSDRKSAYEADITYEQIMSLDLIILEIIWYTLYQYQHLIDGLIPLLSQTLLKADLFYLYSLNKTQAFSFQYQILDVFFYFLVFLQFLTD